MPPAMEKKYWSRYIYLWLNYAIFEEDTAHSPERANLIYDKLLSLIPHEHFTFSKLWILFA